MRLVFGLRVVTARDADEDEDVDDEVDEEEGVGCEVMGMMLVSVLTVCEFSSM